MLITMEDIRRGGGCAWGLRTFFERYNLDLRAFITNGGIDTQELLAIDDALATHIVELATAERERVKNGR